MMRRIIACALLAMLASTTQADTLQDVLSKLAAKPMVRADFTQEKTAPGLRKPLLSTGTLVFSHAQGVLLSMQTPASSELVMSDTTIVQRTSGKATRLRLGGSPYAAVASVFSHLASGDAARLLTTFTVESIDSDGMAWTLRLRPRNRKLQAMLLQVSLAGDEYLREIQIEDERGTRTTMRLTRCRTDPPLTDAELALFKLAH